MTPTPAALKALAEGDIDNFSQASRVGGIEAQEARGQMIMCNASILPKDCPRADLESWGIVFGEDTNDLFVNVIFPEGWKVFRGNSSYWNILRDNKGRPRAEIFYKAAFYDRRASMHLIPRYRVVEAGQYPDRIRFDVVDGTEVIRSFNPGDFPRDDYLETFDNTMEDAETWLGDLHPEWRNPLAYWGEE